MNKKQEQIIEYYVKVKLSGPSISFLLSLPLKEVYNTLKLYNVPRRSRTEATALRLISQDPTFAIPAKLTAEQKELTIAALMLYCAEGGKTGTTVDFTNGSGSVLKVFLKFLRDVCKISENKLRLYLYCFNDQNSDKLKEYWSKYLDVKIYHFTRPYIRYRTTVHIRYSDKLLLETILDLIDKTLKQLI